MERSTIKLFGHPDSGHAFKVRLMLKIAALDHNYEQVDIFAPCESRSAEFRRHATFNEVPLLLDGDDSFVQSNAILVHLARRTGAWGGESQQRLDRCIEWLFWEANKIGMCLPQLRAANRIAGAELSEGAHAWLLARYLHDVQLLDTHLSDGHSFMLGAEPTIADFSLCGYLYFADEAQVTVPLQVSAWLDRLAALPGWQHPYDLMG